MTRDELALETEHLDLLEALTAAKERHRSEQSDDSKAALNAAKADIAAFRALWRGIREFCQPADPEGDGVARPATHTTSLKAG